MRRGGGGLGENNKDDENTTTTASNTHDERLLLSKTNNNAKVMKPLKFPVKKRALNTKKNNRVVRYVLVFLLALFAFRIFFLTEIGEFGKETNEMRTIRRGDRLVLFLKDLVLGIRSKGDETSFKAPSSSSSSIDSIEDDYQDDLKWDENLEQNLSEKQEERKLEAREKRKQDHLLDLPSKKFRLGTIIPDVNSGRCRSRHPPDFFKRQIWKSFELDPKNAPLNASLIEEARKCLVLDVDDTNDDGEDDSTNAIQLTKSFLEKLPLVRGSRVMKMVLEGDIPNGVSPRLEIPTEYLDDGLIGRAFSSSSSSSRSSSSRSSSRSSKGSKEQKEFPRFKTCAVVGTSGTLKEKALGEQIDKHEAVIRTDLGRTVGFEKDVGARTTFDFAAANDLRNLVSNKNAFAGREEDDDVEPEDDSELENENEGAKMRNAKRRRRRNALHPQTLESIVARNSTIVLHELFSRAALRGTYPPFIRAFEQLRRSEEEKGGVRADNEGVPSVAAIEPRLLVRILQTFHRVANALDQNSHETGAPSGARDISSSSRAPISIVATLFALQICDKVNAFGLAPPLAVQSSSSSGGKLDASSSGDEKIGRTRPTYRNYWDRNFAHVGTLKKHGLRDAGWEVARAIGQWPCSGGQLRVIDPKPTVKE
tara:strand:+ start:469 stop:2418 length:1950 start_codon:yes stop_codon:yes gene_type:complete